MTLRGPHHGLTMLAATIALTCLSSSFACTSPRQYSNRGDTSLLSAFVTRSGSDLLLHGQRFRFSGANISWLGLEDYLGGRPPSAERIDSVLHAAKAMNATVVRSITLGSSIGCPNCLEPTLGKFNEGGFRSIDYSVKAAGKQGIRLIVPLVDNWRYYHGGKHTFTEWRGLEQEDDFYRDQRVIEDFEAYISHVLDHVNELTGVALKDDPAIMAWETGNELNTAPAGWSETIGDYIKSIDGHHLVIDGTPQHLADQFQLPSVDMYTKHYMDAQHRPGALDAIDLANLAKHYGKAFFIGEFDWTGKYRSEPLESTLSGWVNAPAIAGDLFWQLFDAGFRGDEYSLHYPGDNDRMQGKAELLKDHATRMGTPVVESNR